MKAYQGQSLPFWRAKPVGLALHRADPLEGGKTAFKTMQWDVQQDLIEIRAHSELQLKSSDGSLDHYTRFEPGTFTLITSEAEAYTLLKTTHFKWCNDVLEVIKPVTFITLTA